ncbi:hypothetical protein [Streptomyces barringtoniae]
MGASAPPLNSIWEQWSITDSRLTPAASAAAPAAASSAPSAGPLPG